MSPQPRRLLLLTQHYPPSSEVAGKPTARLVRYLGALGWETTVLTITEGDIVGPLDAKAYADVLRAAPVERVARWPYLVDVVRAASALRRRAQRGAKPAAAPSAASPSFTWARAGERSGRLLPYLTFPDTKAGWVAPAVLRARHMMAREPFQAMLTVSPPHSTHLAGWAIRRAFSNLPWIAQFHDPWVDFQDDGNAASFLRRSAAYLERQIVTTADQVLVATDEARERYLSRYPRLPGEKFAVLPNGYDPVDFPKAEPRPPEADRPLRFVHLGTIYGGRNPLPFVRGLAQLVAAGELRAGEVKLDFIGDCEPLAALQEAVAAGGLSASTTILRQVDYPEALRRMMASDVLLLLAQAQPYQIPAKLYEYLCANRFILAFTDGASARVVDDTRAGRVVGPDDDVAAALREIVTAHRTGRLAEHALSQERLRSYQAPYLADVLAQHLNRLAPPDLAPPQWRAAGASG